MKIYNIFSIRLDEMGSEVSNIIDAGYADNMPNLDDFIHGLGDYVNCYEPTDKSSDRLIRITVYDNMVLGPSETVAEKWFHEVKGEDRH